jgi:hypothetical protein
VKYLRPTISTRQRKVSFGQNGEMGGQPIVDFRSGQRLFRADKFQ